MRIVTFSAVLLSLLFALSIRAQNTRTFSGAVITQQFELIPGVSIEIETSGEKITATTDAEGAFSVQVPNESISVKFSGNNIAPVTRIFAANDTLVRLQIKTSFVVRPINENVTIEANTITPEVEFRNDSVYKNTLFGRDDQLIQTLNAGINAGQHEGGGKSLEIRRFGFNTDHGGVNGGVKILVDNIQQNQGTQGHGQGYLGNLKSLSPELVENISIINGPFSAAYGDFSGLGVVQIRQRESLPNKFTARIQGGSFNTGRGFFAYSPQIKDVSAFIAYEPSYTDGPFENPLRYRRDNFTGNFTWKYKDNEAVGFKFNVGRNDFTSSGQIPLDEVFAGRLDRFGFIDPENGGKVELGTVGAYFRKEWNSGATFKADAFVGRSLFDLWSNFTFFLADPLYGDEIQQHDSRLQEGANVQYLHPYKFFGTQAIVTVGSNFHFNQINVGLYPSIARNPNRKFLPENLSNPDVLLTSAQANVNNYAGYVQNGMDFFNGHLHVEAGLRWDYFSFDVDGFELSDTETILRGKESAARFQPKLAVAWAPFERFPMTFYGNYGRGIASQDARGVVRNPDAPKISTTDFYQTGTSYNTRRFSATSSFFFIDRSNEQVYIPDDGSIEFAGRSRSYGIEAKTSLRINRFLSFNGGLTQVLKAFYPGEFFEANNSRRRVSIDSAPKTVANGSFVLSELGGFNSSLSWRHISNYRLDGEDDAIRAAGHDVVDFSISKRLRRWIDLNFSVDNLFNKRYFETQNFFESRICPTCEPFERIHATPGYPTTFNVGVTFRLGAKE
ncbi:MAG: Outer membrane receptor proteins, mostly Fe transport [uncultured Pyrinomonadaceae bacterium]|uniref:Outer membrane receptor proteins, mostly Fe transport n=1 Tax=uncultured Pyrinomonadaceae bacterium TaxID=2283094 RepID=A0A6J4NUX9_9BACT|nr:MAG: Outer membrane receptor proteins, mostly Fe transport [uncultured Pyrinomonadaceae bacterium]